MEQFDLHKLEWINGEADEWGGMKIHHAQAQHNFSDCVNAVGIDPGRNFGISIIRDGILTAYWGKLPDVKIPQDWFGFIQLFIKGWIPKKIPTKIALVEGPAYFEKFGQILLEDIRLSFYIAFKEKGFDVSYVPPLVPRKFCLGSGKIKASDIWLQINGNGADSALIALYAGGYLYKENKIEVD